MIGFLPDILAHAIYGILLYASVAGVGRLLTSTGRLRPAFDKSLEYPLGLLAVVFAATAHVWIFAPGGAFPLPGIYLIPIYAIPLFFLLKNRRRESGLFSITATLILLAFLATYNAMLYRGPSAMYTGEPLADQMIYVSVSTSAYLNSWAQDLTVFGQATRPFVQIAPMYIGAFLKHLFGADLPLVFAVSLPVFALLSIFTELRKLLLARGQSLDPLRDTALISAACLAVFSLVSNYTFVDMPSGTLMLPSAISLARLHLGRLGIRAIAAGCLVFAALAIATKITGIIPVAIVCGLSALRAEGFKAMVRRHWFLSGLTAVSLLGGALFLLGILIKKTAFLEIMPPQSLGRLWENPYYRALSIRPIWLVALAGLGGEALGVAAFAVFGMAYLFWLSPLNFGIQYLTLFCVLAYTCQKGSERRIAVIVPLLAILSAHYLYLNQQEYWLDRLGPFHPFPRMTPYFLSFSLAAVLIAGLGIRFRRLFSAMALAIAIPAMLPIIWGLLPESREALQLPSNINLPNFVYETEDFDIWRAAREKTEKGSLIFTDLTSELRRAQPQEPPKAIDKYPERFSSRNYLPSLSERQTYIAGWRHSKLAAPRNEGELVDRLSKNSDVLSGNLKPGQIAELGGFGEFYAVIRRQRPFPSHWQKIHENRKYLLLRIL